jgi:predicted ATP-grasp superfamily ATP-dependent carboligase
MRKLILIGAIKTGTSHSLVAGALRRGLTVTVFTAHNDPLDGIFPPQVEIVATDLELDTVVHWLRQDPALREGRLLVTTANNRYARFAASVAAALELPGPGVHSIDQAVSKQAQKRLLQRAGVATPNFVACSFSTLAQCAQEIQSLRWPVVAKPEEGSESFGVRLCSEFGEVSRHGEQLCQLLERTPKTGLFDRLVIEEYLVGPEYCIELFDGVFVGVLRKVKQHGSRFIERGYTSDLDLDETMLARLAETAQRAGQVSGLAWGPVHLDCIVHQGVPNIIEINARIAGSFICSLVKDAYGFDLVEALLDKLLGTPVRLPAPRLPRSYARVDFLLDDDPCGWNFTGAGHCENDDVLISYGPQVVDHRERRAFVYFRAKPVPDSAPAPPGTPHTLENRCPAN